MCIRDSDPADAREASAPPRLLPVRVSTVGRHKVGDWLAELQDHLIRKHAFHSAPLEAIARWVGADDLFDSVVAVSYTHLDVYKRQHHTYGLRSSIHKVDASGVGESSR